MLCIHLDFHESQQSLLMVKLIFFLCKLNPNYASKYLELLSAMQDTGKYPLISPVILGFGNNSTEKEGHF